MFKFLKFLPTLPVVFVIIFHSTTSYSANVYSAYDECTLVDGAITDTDECITQPKGQEVTLYKMAFCTANPINDDATAAGTQTIDTTNLPCSTLWESAEGVLVSITQDVASTVTGDIEIPEPGVYPYVYMEMGPVFRVRDYKLFETVSAGSRTGSVADSGTGPYCYSLYKSGANLYSHRSSTVGYSNCVATEAEATANYEWTYNFVNAASVGTGDQVSAGDGSLCGSSLTFSSEQDPTVTIQGFLVESDYTLADCTGKDVTNSVDRIVSVASQSITITEETIGFDVSYNNRYGTTIPMSSTLVKNFGAGPFDVFITPLNEIPVQ